MGLLQMQFAGLRVTAVDKRSDGTLRYELRVLRARSLQRCRRKRVYTVLCFLRGRPKFVSIVWNVGSVPVKMRMKGNTARRTATTYFRVCPSVSRGCAGCAILAYILTCLYVTRALTYQ